MRQRAKQCLYWWEHVFTNAGLLDITLDNLSLGRAALQQAIEQSSLSAGAATSAAPGLAPDLFCILRPGKETETDTNGKAMHEAEGWLNQAVDGLRAAGQEQYLPLGLLAHAARHRWAVVLLNQTATAQAEQDLRETEEIAKRGGMQLHLIDFHLEAARLALTVGRPVLERTAAEHLATAKIGIDKTGYKRRLPEAEHIEGLL